MSEARQAQCRFSGIDAVGARWLKAAAFNTRAKEK